MNNLQFDKHIKEQFSNYAPDVDPRIWENIMAERERRKPVGFWFNMLNRRNGLLLLCLLLAGGAATWILTKNNTGNTGTGLVAGSNKLPASNEKPVTTSAQTTDIKTTTEQSTSTALSTDNDLSNDSPVTVNNSSAYSNNGASLTSAATSRIRINSPALQNTEEDNVPGYAGMSFIKKSNRKKTTALGNIRIHPGDEMEENGDDMPGQGTMLGRLTYNAEKISASRKTKNQLPLSFDPIIYLPGCPSIERDAAGNKKYLEIYAGPDMAFRSLSDTGNSAYLQKRKESAKFTSAYSAGIRYTKVFNNSMSIRAAVNYSQINEKFTYAQGNLVQITYIIDANGDTTGSFITTGTRYKTTHNKYRSIDIPLMVGYEVGNGKLHANINAGPVVNIYSWQKGEVLDQSGQPVNITTGKSSSPYQFKTNAGIGFMGAISVYYRLNDKIHLMAEPYFRYNLSPMNKDNITLKQKYQTAGLRLGLRFDIK